MGYAAAEPTSARERQRLELRMLIRFRWLTVIGLVGLLATAGLWDSAPTLLAVLGVAAVLVVISNVWLSSALLHLADVQAMSGRWVLVLDTLLLTCLLAASGGVTNPFSALYLMYVVLAAMLAPPLWAWALWMLGVACWGALFLLPNEHLHHMGGHLIGMWVVYILLGPLLAYVLIRLRRERAELQGRLVSMRTQQARAERLASLGTLAAGAAHELSTPLSTISVVLHELRAGIDSNSSIAADLTLMATEVERCVEVLEQLSTDAGSGVGELADSITVSQLIDDLLARLPASLAERVALEVSVADLCIVVPRRLLARALRGLVKNAVEASASGSSVMLRAAKADGFVQLEVEDCGGGMPAEVMERATEPFFTTKDPGQGMGLGLFVARSVVEELDGQLEIVRSGVDTGTLVRVLLPAVPALAQAGSSAGAS